MTRREPLEISDLIVDYDLETLERRSVRQNEVVSRLRDNGQHRAARYVQTLPALEGTLDADACDGVLLRSHAELQRLSEEFLQTDRLRALLVPLLKVLRGLGVPPPLRIVDVGCGLGYLVRSLAAHGRLGRDVDLLGCDMNVALVEAARRLADEESLACQFKTANAFTLEQPAHVFVSTGVVHHFRGPSLNAFFAGQRQAYAFIHYDMQASAVSPLGAWIFHQTRMREPLARHDGVASAVRAHPPTLLAATARAATGFRCASFDGATHVWEAVLRPMHALVGTRSELWEPYVAALGPLRARLA